MGAVASCAAAGAVAYLEQPRSLTALLPPQPKPQLLRGADCPVLWEAAGGDPAPCKEVRCKEPAWAGWPVTAGEAAELSGLGSSFELDPK